MVGWTEYLLGHLGSSAPRQRAARLGRFSGQSRQRTDAIGLESASQLTGLPKAEIGLRQASRGVCATLRVQ